MARRTLVPAPRRPRRGGAERAQRGWDTARGSRTLLSSTWWTRSKLTDWDFDKTRGVYRHGFSNVLPLDPSLHVSCDILVEAIQRARDGMLVTVGGILLPISLHAWKWAPAGVVEDPIWWSGASHYYGGRAPMARMAELPDDALRCICEQLVPPVLRSNEELDGGSTGVLWRISLHGRAPMARCSAARRRPCAASASSWCRWFG